MLPDTNLPQGGYTPCHRLGKVIYCCMSGILSRKATPNGWAKNSPKVLWVLRVGISNNFFYNSYNSPVETWIRLKGQLMEKRPSSDYWFCYMCPQQTANGYRTPISVLSLKLKSCQCHFVGNLMHMVTSIPYRNTVTVPIHKTKQKGWIPYTL